MRRFSCCFGVLVVVVAFAMPLVSHADTVGAIGRVAAIRVNTSASDDFGSFHGWVLIGDSIGGALTYKWGGSHCPGVNLEPDDRSVLQSGLDNPRLLVEPRYKIGQGGNLCLVAFILVLRNEESLLP
jgi:hypothetical protein